MLLLSLHGAWADSGDTGSMPPPNGSDWSSSGYGDRITELGTAVLGAGDIDGDGLGDIAFSGRYHAPERRFRFFRVWVYSAPTTSAEAGEMLSALSSRPLAAGDFDGDGVTELPVSTPQGAVVYARGADGVQSTGVTLPCGSDGGWGVCTGGGVGDVDADGYDDLLLSGGDGSALWYRGGPDGVSGASAAVLVGDEASFGAAITGADLDRDGYADAIVGQPDADGVYIWWGSPDGFLDSGTLLTQPADEHRFGASLAVGDLDGDGAPELVIGAPEPADAGLETGPYGRVYVYSGGAGGPEDTPGTTLTGGDWPEQFGASMACPGDFDVDGYDDLAVAAPAHDVAVGAVRVFRGSAAGLVVSSPTGWLGEDQASRFGEALAAAGDVNGDGAGDLLVGAPGYALGLGRVYLYLGEPPAEPDEDEDGVGAGTDCDDQDPAIHPGAVEACDGVDQDCDALIDEGCPGGDTADTGATDDTGDPVGPPADPDCGGGCGGARAAVGVGILGILLSRRRRRPE